jgi:hypothetical protein
MRRRVLAFVLILIAAIAIAFPAMAGEKRALLVGVSGYRNLLEQNHLYAPKNDVVVMKKALMARGFKAEDITILADQVSGSAGDPTDANIRAQLAALARQERRPDDVLVVYLSGHGTNVKDQPGGDEADGYDEVFLPIDFMPVDKSADGPGVPAANYLRDDDLGAAIAAIVARGGETVFILDSCFSGTGLKGSARPKLLSSAFMGEEAGPVTGKDGNAVSALDDLAGLKGTLAAFFASSDDQVSLEVSLAPGGARRDEWLSAFTGAFVEALGSDTSQRYSDLFLNTVRILKSDPTLGSRQNPGRFGNGFERGVFGDEKPPESRTVWLAEKGIVLAGQIDGLTEDSVVALYDRAEAKDDEAIAYAQAFEVGAVSARLEAVKFPCGGKLKPVCQPLGDPDVVQQPHFARLVRPGVEPRLTVSMPMVLPGAAETEKLRAMLDLAKALAARLPDEQVATAEFGKPLDLVWYVSETEFRFQPESVPAGDTIFGPVVRFAESGSQVETLLPATQAVLKRGKVIKRLFGLKGSLKAMRRGAASVTAVLSPQTDECAAEAAKETGAREVCGWVQIDKLVNKGDIAFRPYVFLVDDDWNLQKIRSGDCAPEDTLEPASENSRSRRLRYGSADVREVRKQYPGARAVRHGFVLIAIPEMNAMADPCVLLHAFENRKGTGDSEEDALGDLVAGKGDKGKGGDMEGRIVVDFLPWDVVLR